MGGELVLGKTEGQFTIPGDTRLSPRHCGIYRREGFFYVEDLQSTNGTYLNGVPVAGPQRLEQDSILLAGSMELRVVWEEV
jgi:pSer/pThr/pTyr-binding forkhead associated (FHA) protein